MVGRWLAHLQMFQDVARTDESAEVNVGMHQATTDWTQEMTVPERILADEVATGSVRVRWSIWKTAGPSHSKGSDRHRRQEGSNVFYEGRTVTMSKLDNLGLFIGEFGNSHSRLRKRSFPIWSPGASL